MEILLRRNGNARGTTTTTAAMMMMMIPEIRCVLHARDTLLERVGLSRRTDRRTTGVCPCGSSLLRPLIGARSPERMRGTMMMPKTIHRRAGRQKPSTQNLSIVKLNLTSIIFSFFYYCPLVSLVYHTHAHTHKKKERKTIYPRNHGSGTALGFVTRRRSLRSRTSCRHDDDIRRRNQRIDECNNNNNNTNGLRFVFSSVFLFFFSSL